MNAWHCAVVLSIAWAVRAAPAQTPQATQPAPSQPVRAQYGEDQPWSESIELRLVGMYGPDGEPIPLGEKAPTPRMRDGLAARMAELTPEQGLARLKELADLDPIFTRKIGPTGRAAELGRLAALTAEADPGGAEFLRALHHLMVATDQAGQDPLGLIYVRPMPRITMSGDALNNLATDVLFLRLTPQSCRQLEADFGPWIGKALQEPGGGTVFRGPPDMTAPRAADYFRSLARHMLASGFASPEFAREMAQPFVDRLVQELGGDKDWGRDEDDALFLLHANQALTVEHVTQLLSQMAPDLSSLAPPEDAEAGRRISRAYDALDRMVGLPELTAEQARTVLALVCAQGAGNEGIEAQLRTVCRSVLARFNSEELYAGAVPEVVATRLAADAARGGYPRPVDVPRHVRVSTWRFLPGGGVERAAQVGFETRPGVWTVQSWGAPVGFGTIAVRPGPTEIGWRLVGAQRRPDDANWVTQEGSTGARGTKNRTARFALQRTVGVPLRDMLAGSYEHATLYMSIIEVGAEPIAQDPELPDLYALLDVRSGRDRTWTAAAFRWLAARPEPGVRTMLMDACRLGGADGDSASPAAAALLERQDWQAFDDLLPNLIKRRRDGGPWLVIAFEEAARSNRAPEGERLRWARAIIRTQITAPMHPQNVQRLLKLCESLGAPAVGYDPEGTEQAREEALGKARQWAQ